MLTEKDYCDYETQKSLMNIGFPTKAQSYDLGKDVKEYLPKIHLYDAQKWLREGKNIGVFVSGFKNVYTFWVNSLLNAATLYQGFFDNQTGKKYETYEEALSEGIKEAVKILKEE